MKATLKKLERALAKEGVLLLSDPSLPSVTTIIAGKPVKGSWWGHEKGSLMYNCSGELGERADVLVLKLFNGKVTFLEKRHWNALFAIATSRAEWQQKKLTPFVKALWKKIEAAGEIRADDPALKRSASEVGKLGSSLEARLLIYSESIHTESGKHLRLLKTWPVAMKNKGHRAEKIPYEAALAHFERLRERLAARAGSKVSLPWD
jgi:hypothetical protein